MPIKMDVVYVMDNVSHEIQSAEVSKGSSIAVGLSNLYCKVISYFKEIAFAVSGKRYFYSDRTDSSVNYGDGHE